MSVVGRVDLLTCMIEHALRNLEFDPQAGEAGAACATEVMSRELGDFKVPKSVRAACDTSSDVLRVYRTRTVHAGQNTERAARHLLEAAKLPWCPSIALTTISPGSQR